MFTPGATSLNGDCGLRWLYFNPRTRMGCDRYAGTMTRRPAHFNPRTRMGCDRLTVRIPESYKKFQSTHPRGVRQNGWSDFVAAVKFQSTHPRGVRRVSARRTREQ